jgi:hypothetical protein
MTAARRHTGKLIGGIAAVALLGFGAYLGLPHLPGAAADRETTAAMLGGYCLDCHNPIDLAGNLEIDPAALADVGAHAETWEKVVHKLNARSMPPVGEPRPEAQTYAAITAWLEGELDAAAAAAPDPGHLPQLHRLTRTEYRNAIRDLLALENLPAEMNYELLLPADNASSGFDNIADLLFVSPVIMERYLGAAQKIARLAIGDPTMPTMVNIHRLPLELPQDVAIEGLPLGTRGGFVTASYFPLDAEYLVAVDLAGGGREPHEIEITVDGERVALGRTGGRGSDLQFRVPIAAGPHVIGASFVRRTHALDESTVRVQRRSRGSLPAIELVTISGPFAPTGPGDTRLFRCRRLSALPRSRAASRWW